MVTEGATLTELCWPSKLKQAADFPLPKLIPASSPSLSEAESEPSPSPFQKPTSPAGERMAVGGGKLHFGCALAPPSWLISVPLSVLLYNEISSSAPIKRSLSP